MQGWLTVLVTFYNFLLSYTPYFTFGKYKVLELEKDTSVRFGQGLEDENH